ncbi:MAG: exodeoxyribonuclease VII small subunit [Chlamydiota bacterium]
MTEEQQAPPSFEQAYVRLEQILEKMNSGKASLEEAIKLYEEADKLISSCNVRLNEAERKIETLIKSREGELLLSEENKPLTQSFS